MGKPGDNPNKVAIIIPCFNSEALIDRALVSALNQPDVDLEVVVIDDGSTDQSATRAKKHPNVRVISTPNKGAAAARNMGLKASTAPLVKFLDADDELLENTLSNQLRESGQLRDEEIHVGNWHVLTDSEEKLNQAKRLPPGKQIVCLILKNILTTGPLHKRRLLEQVGGFDERFRWNQEWNLHVRLAAAGASFVVHDGAVYRAHRQSEESRITNKKTKSPGYVQNELQMIEWTRQSIGASEETDKALAFRAMGVAKTAAKLGRLADAHSALSFARAISPVHYRAFWPAKYSLIHRALGDRRGDHLLIKFWQKP
ncbi:MAG: glycosyltransferase family 2 protein [Algiphilus sp.]